jgi:hypothetical protein
MPRRQVHEILSLPAVKNAVQRPDAIVRVKCCCVVIGLVAGVLRNDRMEKEEAMLRVSMTQLELVVEIFFLVEALTS